MCLRPEIHVPATVDYVSFLPPVESAMELAEARQHGGIVASGTEDVKPEASPETCQHVKLVTDPSTDQTWCAVCGVQLLDRPVPVGGRLVPPGEFMHRVQAVVRIIDDEILIREQRKHELLSTAARIQSRSCEYSNCEAPPLLRSKYCPIHRQLHRRILGRERQRRHRLKTPPAPDQPVQVPAPR
jgi:hypothetical protein